MSDDPLNNEQIEPSSPLPINTQGSKPSNMPLEAPESPKNADIPVSLNNANTPNLSENPEVTKPAESVSVEAENQKTEPISEPVNPEPVSIPASSEVGTGQIPVSDPLPSSISDTANKPVSVISKPSQKDLWKRFLDKVQIGKRKKLEKIMTLFDNKTPAPAQGFVEVKKITNDEVEKFLRVSDKTAERYLNILEKENRIKQVGKTGHAVN